MDTESLNRAHRNEEGDKYTKTAAFATDNAKPTMTTINVIKKSTKIVVQNICQNHWTNQTNKSKYTTMAIV